MRREKIHLSPQPGFSGSRQRIWSIEFEVAFCLPRATEQNYLYTIKVQRRWARSGERSIVATLKTAIEPRLQALLLTLVPPESSLKRSPSTQLVESSIHQKASRSHTIPPYYLLPSTNSCLAPCPARVSAPGSCTRSQRRPYRANKLPIYPSRPATSVVEEKKQRSKAILQTTEFHSKAIHKPP